MAALFAGTIGADAKKVNYIPFSGGGESLAAILGGKVTAGISGMSEYEGQIKSGKLRALGVMSAERSQAFPDVPTLKEQGLPGLDVETWYGVFAPHGTLGAVTWGAPGWESADPARAQTHYDQLSGLSVAKARGLLHVVGS